MNQPLTEAELAEMDRKLTEAIDRDGELYLVTDAPKDMRRLLAELRQTRSALAVAQGLEEDGDLPVFDYSKPVNQSDIRKIAEEIAADGAPYRNWWERKLYATVVSLRARLFEIRDERDHLRAEADRVPALEATIARRDETIARRQEQAENDAALLSEANGKVSELDSKLRKATAALDRVRAVADSDDALLIPMRVRLQSALIGAPSSEPN